MVKASLSFMTTLGSSLATELPYTNMLMAARRDKTLYLYFVNRDFIMTIPELKQI